MTDPSAQTSQFDADTANDEPLDDQSATVEASAEQVAAEEPRAEEPAPAEPTVEEPSGVEPVTADLEAATPPAEESAPAEPAVEEPSGVEPVTADLEAATPLAEEPAPAGSPAEEPSADLESASKESATEAGAVEADAPQPESEPAAPRETTDAASTKSAIATAAAKAKPAKKKRAKPKAPRAEAGPLNPKVASLQKAMDEGASVEGKVIGWNNGGLHVVIDGVTAFCPHSEMEIGGPQAPETYLDQSYRFRVLKIQKRGKRVVVSRASDLKSERSERRAEIRQRVSDGAVIKGRVASVTDFGAFVDIGGVQGLVHVSEMSRQRVQDPREVLSPGDEVSVKVLKVEQGGRRISLSMKALEPDPWDGVADRFSIGSVVKGTVDKTTTFGAFVLLEPGLTGLLPTSGMNLPRDARPGRVFSPGKELSVQITGVDPRRRRISLALEGSQVEGSRSDYETFVKGQRQAQSGEGFNALAAALEKIRAPTK